MYNTSIITLITLSETNLFYGDTRSSQIFFTFILYSYILYVIGAGRINEWTKVFPRFKAKALINSKNIQLGILMCFFNLMYFNRLRKISLFEEARHIKRIPNLITQRILKHDNLKTTIILKNSDCNIVLFLLKNIRLK